MGDKFGEIAWNCYKDNAPIYEAYVYAYMPWNSDDINIGPSEEFNFRNSDYWAYVFMPDPPKIEKKDKKNADYMLNYIEHLENRINLLDIKINRMGKD